MPYTDFHYTPTGTGVISGKEVLEQTEDAINDLGGQISGDVQTAIDTANNALNTANTASSDAQNAVNTVNTAYTAATEAQNTASNALTAAQNAQNDVNALGNRVTTAENNITQNTTDISGLTTRMGTAEGNITNLQNDVVTAQATANSAQQTATTARQQSYVFRYSSTALTPSSTNSNSLLDNTDNVKIGDKVLDSEGKLFALTAVDTQNSTFTIGTALMNVGAVALPIGSYIQFAGSQAPDGFLVCNGGEISRTTYSALFAVIGTTYGSGDGSTTFNLPDLTDRFLQGSTTSGTVKDAGLPNITGTMMLWQYPGWESQSTGAISSSLTGSFSGISGGNYVLKDSNMAFNASHSSSIYGNSSTVQPPALTCLICIKY